MHAAEKTRKRTIPGITLMLARSLIVLMVFSQSWIAYAGVLSGSHAQFAGAVHDGTVSMTHGDADGHGHDHAGDEAEDLGHQHEHDAADHSHDKPNIRHGGLHASLQLTVCWASASCTPAYASPCFCLERPPKLLA